MSEYRIRRKINAKSVMPRVAINPIFGIEPNDSEYQRARPFIITALQVPLAVAQTKTTLR